MFNALVRLKKDTPIPMIGGGICMAEGAYLATAPTAFINSLANQTRFSRRVLIKVDSPELYRYSVGGNGSVINRQDRVPNVNQGILDQCIVNFVQGNVECLIKGQEVVVDDENLLSYGTRGKLRGFTKGANGNILAYIDYNEEAAPLRISADKIKLWRPNAFWMVQPSNLNANRQPQNTLASAVGNGPLDYVFNTRRSASNYAASLTRETGYNHVVMEVVEFVTREGQTLSY